MVVDYKSRKNEVLASYDTVEVLIKELQEYAEKIELPDPTERLKSNLLSDIRSKAQKVKEDRFNIMIAGESKSGKSTFINAYLGVELLPMDVKQCTSAIVEIKWGEVFSVKATYADGRTKEISGEDEAREFLKKNAALDDEYRDIPVPTINSEILVKSGLRALEKGGTIKIYDIEVKEMLKAPEVQSANIYNLPNYNERIKAYINARKDTWQDIVTKIEIMFPFGEDLRGIEIIDSPGVCARGGVAEITSKYIENADAIIFLKPVIGQSLESTQFSQFMENASVERSKNALFLVLTHIAAKNDADLRRLEEEAYKQFSEKLDKRNILFVDSKAELYAKKFANIENNKDIKDELRKLESEGTLDDFVKVAYAEAKDIFGDSDTVDTADFIKNLQEKSRFNQMYSALDIFGRNAHYLLLEALLESIEDLYATLSSGLSSNIDLYRSKAEDPKELAKKIGILKNELEEIENMIYKGVNQEARRFRGDEGIIRTTAEAAVNDFLSEVEKIDPNASDAFERLEKASMRKIEKFSSLTKKLQEDVVAEFDKNLIALSHPDSIPFESLKPNFTDDTFRKILEDTRGKAKVTKYEEGGTFKKSKTYSVYSQNRHFRFLLDNIKERLQDIKTEMVGILMDFVSGISKMYLAELGKNADAKKAEYDAIIEAKATAEQITKIIEVLTDKQNRIAEAKTTAISLKGGITKYVQHND